MIVTKAFFRYLRGELLNGFYIRKLNLLVNQLKSLEALKVELLYWMNVQFNEKTGFNVLREADTKGIAQIAGLLSIRGLTDFLVGWVTLSESHIISGKERSERGLFNQNTASLEYVRTDVDTYSTDIETAATDYLRMCLIPNGQEPIGYVYGDVAAILTDSGKVPEVFLYAAPPLGYEFNETTQQWYWPLDFSVNPPPLYAPWYGDKFLPLTTTNFINVALPDNLLTYLLQVHQMIKFNGLGLMYLFEATAEIIPDLITDLKLEMIDGFGTTGFTSWHLKLTFTRLEYNFSTKNGWMRFAAWGYFLRSKYPFLQFTETGE